MRPDVRGTTMTMLGNKPLAGLERLEYERSIVEHYTQAFGWRSVVNVVWPLVGWLTVVWGYRADRLPLLAAIPAAAVFLQAFYMPVHESVHRTISAGRTQWAWLDRAVGSFGAWMLYMSFAEHRHIHLLHHTHTNDEGDPDLLNAKGTPRDIAVRVTLGALLFPIVPILAVIPGGTRLLPGAILQRLGAAAAFRPAEIRRAAALVTWSHLALLAAGTLVGFGVEVWLLFYLAHWLGRFFLSLVFGWLPHHPHGEVGRYRDTRVFTFPGSTFLIRGHDHHLLHHLWPTVPHYKLRRLWNEIGPHLAQQGARIEGRAARQLGIEPQ